MYTATSYFFTLSLHDALPISFSRMLMNERFVISSQRLWAVWPMTIWVTFFCLATSPITLATGRFSLYLMIRSEEHTSELQSRPHLVCRLLLEKKKYNI